MRFDCEATQEHIDAWALDALDAPEREAIARHLAQCDACSALAREAADAAALVALAVPMRAASASLKSRVMASARVLTPSRQHAGVSHWWRTAAAGIALIAVGALSWGTVMQLRAGDVENARDHVSAEATQQAVRMVALRADLDTNAGEQQQLHDAIESQNAVLDVVFQPDVKWTTMDGTAIAPAAKGRCAWSRDAALGAMIAQNLPPAPEGQSYTMWLIYENDWISAGSFNVDSEGRGRLVMRKIWGDQAHGRLLGFAVTLEQNRDAAEPSTELALASPIE